MRRFWLYLFIYLLPFVMGFVALTGSMMYIGESMPLNRVIASQVEDESLVLYRPRYGNRDQQYKLMTANQRQAPLMIIGSSRGLQFRAGFADQNPDLFYNTAAPAWTLDEVTNLLYHMDEAALPEVILLALDLPWYTDAYQETEFPQPVSDFSNIFLVNRSFLQEVVRGETFDYERYFARVEPGSQSGLALGMRAIRDGHGFRNDGSEQFGDYLVAGWLWQPQQRDRHLDLMRQCEDVYPCDTSISQNQLDETRKLLDWAHDKNILVVGFLPSYMPSLWAEMSQSPQHTYIHQAHDALAQLFAEFEFPFFDYSDGQWLGLTDEDFFDGWHASEKGNLALYIQLVRYVPELSRYSDLATLEAIFANSQNTWQVFYP